MVDDNHVDSMINYLNNASRFPLSLEKNSPFNNDMYNFFQSNLKKVKRQSFEYNDIKFYQSNSGNMKIYTVKSKMFDLYLLVAILFYLLLLYIYTKGLKNFIIGVKGIFQTEDE